MPRTDIIIGLLVLLAVFNGLRAGVIARVFAWLGVAGGFLLLSSTIPLIDGFVDPENPTRGLLLKVGAGIVTVIAGALIGTLIGRILRVGVRLTPLSLLDRLGGVILSLAVITIGIGSVLNAGARLPGGIGEDVRRSYSYSQVERLTASAPSLFDLLRRDAAGEESNG